MQQRRRLIFPRARTMRKIAQPCSRQLRADRHYRCIHSTCRLLSTQQGAGFVAVRRPRNRRDQDERRTTPHVDNTSNVKLLQDHIRTVSLCLKPTKGDIQAAEQSLTRLEVTAASTGLTTTPYNRLIRAYAKSQERDSVEKAQTLLRRMKETPGAPAPDTFTYDAALYVCTKSSHAQAAEMAEQWLHEMEALGAKSDSTVSPTITSYQNVILAHANQSASVYGAAAAAEDWLMRLSELSCRTDNQHDLRPTTQAFNHVLQAWATSLENNGADRALQVLALMITLDDANTNPDATSFATVIHAFARRNRPEEAELVLKRALSHYIASNTSADLTPCLNRTLGAWSTSRHEHATRRAKELLDDAYALSASSSSIVLGPDAASHYYYVMTLLNDEQAGVKEADEHLHSMFQQCLTNKTRQTRLPVVAPSIGTVHTVMRAWSRSKFEAKADRVMELLRQVVHLAAKSERHTESYPVPGTFSICIDAWIKSGRSDAAERVLEVLNMAEELNCTDAFCYQAAINILCRARTEETTWKAVDVLKRYQQRADFGEAKWVSSQSIGLYTSVISELARIRSETAAATALDLFRNIPSAGTRAARPTSKTYSSLMVCFCKLDTADAAKVVFNLFQEMRQLDSDPASKVSLDAFAFRTVLRSLVRVQDHAHAYEVLSCLCDCIQKGRIDLAEVSLLNECLELLPRLGLSSAKSHEVALELKSIIRKRYL